MRKKSMRFPDDASFKAWLEDLMREYGYRLYDIERMDTEVSEFGTDTPIITVAENDSIDCIVYVRVGKVMYYECFIGV